MNVSLSRKIHIIALPQGMTKACLSDAKSPTTPGRPGIVPAGSTTLVAASAVMVLPASSGLQQQAEQHQPDQQQEMPVDGAELDGEPHRLDIGIRTVETGARSEPRDEPAHQVQHMDAGEQVERGV